MNHSKQGGMGKKAIIVLVIGLTLASVHRAEAQQAGKVARIGYLAVNSPSLDKQLIEAFQQGLRGLGWVDGQNITIEYRFAEGKLDQLHALVAELVRLKVDIIVADGTGGALGVGKLKDDRSAIRSSNTEMVASLARHPIMIARSTSGRNEMYWRLFSGTTTLLSRSYFQPMCFLSNIACIPASRSVVQFTTG